MTMVSPPSPLSPILQPDQRPVPTVSATGTIALAVAALYLARDILIPLALAILLSFVLSPLVAWLRRRKLPRVVAVTVVVAFACSILLVLAVAVGAQLVQLAEALPGYQRNIQSKIQTIQSSLPGQSVLSRVSSTIQDLRREIAKSTAPAREAAAHADDPEQPKPLPVTIEPGPPQTLDVLQSLLSSLLGPFGTAGLVVIFVFFMLIEQDEMRDRFIRLVGGHDLKRSTDAVNDAALRVSRYLGSQLIVNISYGVPVGLGLAFIGVPNAILWGVLATTLRFIPYLGPWLAAAFPIIIAFGQDPGWSMVLWTIALFITLELITNNILEPWLYGVSTGLTSFAVIFAAIFWTVLWGPVGLFLATPLTVSLVALGRYIPSLEFLDLLLGSERALTPPQRFYQRVLSNNVEDAFDVAEDFAATAGTRSWYRDILFPSLVLAENDRLQNEDLAARRALAANIVAVVSEVVERLAELQGSKDAADQETGSARPSCAACHVVNIGGRTELDLAAATATATYLAEYGIPGSAAPLASHLAATDDADVTDGGDPIVILHYLHPRPRAMARFAMKRLQRRSPKNRFLICCWNITSAGSLADELSRSVGHQITVVTTLDGIEKEIGLV